MSFVAISALERPGAPSPGPDSIGYWLLKSKGMGGPNLPASSPVSMSFRSASTAHSSPS